APQPQPPPNGYNASQHNSTNHGAHLHHCHPCRRGAAGAPGAVRVDGRGAPHSPQAGGRRRWHACVPPAAGGGRPGGCGDPDAGCGGRGAVSGRAHAAAAAAAAVGGRGHARAAPAALGAHRRVEPPGYERRQGRHHDGRRQRLARRHDVGRQPQRRRQLDGGQRRQLRLRGPRGPARRGRPLQPLCLLSAAQLACSSSPAPLLGPSAMPPPQLRHVGAERMHIHMRPRPFQTAALPPRHTLYCAWPALRCAPATSSALRTARCKHMRAAAVPLNPAPSSINLHPPSSSDKPRRTCCTP
ncbi:MAG: hypothetical protein J3K34DRAFT_84633, partial [Monoraphidium minutum]